MLEILHYKLIFQPWSSPFLRHFFFHLLFYNFLLKAVADVEAGAGQSTTSDSEWSINEDVEIGWWNRQRRRRTRRQTAAAAATASGAIYIDGIEGDREAGIESPHYLNQEIITEG
ncbi:unnamed protein product, partial [Protopolystoma xenopodis]